MLLGSLALPDWVRHTWRDQGHQRAPLAGALQTWKKAANARSGPKLEKSEAFQLFGRACRIMLCSMFTPIRSTINCHYLAILLMVRFCNAVRCWSASHVEHGVKDQVASEHFAHNITGHRGAQLHKYTLLLTVLLSSVLVHGIICLIWILENIKNDANQITQRRYADF